VPGVPEDGPLTEMLLVGGGGGGALAPTKKDECWKTFDSAPRQTLSLGAKLPWLV
jgi:hypothetical protein